MGGPTAPFSLSAALAPFSETLLYDDFDSLSLRSGGPSEAGYGAGSGVWTPRLIPDDAEKGSTHLAERQFYADPAYAWNGGFTPFSVASSVLTVRAQETPAGIAAQMPTNANTEAAYDYVSGVLTTRHSFRFKPPVLIEARMKLPKGRAIWPALWTLPQDGEWPPEVDIMEYDGGQPNKLNVGWFAGPPDPYENESAFNDLGLGDLSADYHVFGVAWFDDVLIFMVDNSEILRLRSHADFDQWHYLVFNLAVGGSFVDEPDETTPSPADLLVDWVRIRGTTETVSEWM